MARQFKTGLIIEGDAKGGIRAIRATDDQLKQLNSGFQKGGRQAQRYGRQVSSTDRTLAAIRRTALTAATALASVFAVRTLQGQIDFADELQKTRDRIGASTEALSQYNYVAQMSGVQLNTLTTAWQRQTRRINEAARGTGVASEALQRLGLDARVLASMRPEDQFEAIAEAMEGIADEGERVALAQKIWDSGGVQLLQMTNQGAAAMREMREEADRLGLTITNETADNMAAFNDEISRVKFALQGLTATMLAEVVPSLTDGVTRVNGWIEALGGAEVVLGHVRTGVSVLAALMAGRAAQSLATYVAAKYAAVTASVALNGALVTLRTTLLTLMGPVGLIVAGAGLLYTFREELGLVSREADQTRLDVQGLSSAFRDLTVAQQENRRANLVGDLVEMRMEASRLGSELAQVTQLVRQSGQLTPQGGAMPVASAEDIARGRELRGELAQVLTTIGDGTELLDEYDQIMGELGQTTATTTASTRELSTASSDAARAAQQQQQAAAQLLDRLFPLEAAQRRYREELELLHEVDWSDRTMRQAEAQERLAEAYRETITSLGAFDDVFEAYPGLFDPEQGGDEAGSYWERWLEGAETALGSFDQIAGNTFDRFHAASGQAFESMIFDAQSAGDAMRGLADTMLRSIVRALGEMAAQWVTYHAVQMALGRTSEAAAVGSAAITGGAIAKAYAPAAAFASLASFGMNSGPAIAGISSTVGVAQGLALTGMAHDGIDRIPREGTWLLDKGERVMNRPQADRLDDYLDRQQGKDRQRDGARVTVNLIEDAERAGSVEQESMDDEEIINVFVANIASGGDAARAIEATYGVSRQGR